MNEELVPTERVLLGAILLCETMAAEILATNLTDEHFSLREHRLILAAIKEVYTNQPNALDPVTVSEHLVSQCKLHLAGGYEYLDDLTQGIPRSINWRYYLGILQSRHAKRSLHKLCHEVLAMDRESATVDEQRNHLQLGMDQLFQEDGQTGAWHADTAAATHQNLVQRAMGDEPSFGVPSGFPKLDEITLGWWPKTLNILAARPAIGKTALAVAMASAAARSGAVVYYSFEMAREELVHRWQAMEANINLHHLRAARLSENDWACLGQIMAKPQPDILYVDELAPTAWAIQTHLTALTRRKPVSLVIIDHLHEMHANTHGHGRANNRNQELTHIVQSLKNLARHCHLPILLLSQLNRDIERRRNPRPILADLRDSGSIEQSADLVIFLHRPQATGLNGTATSIDEPAIQNAELIIAKHRNGPTGTVPMAFWKRFAKFTEGH